MKWPGIVVFLALLAAANTAGALELSSRDQRQFAFRRDPDSLCVRPGNDGLLVLAGSDPATSRPGNLEVWQDEYCDARWLDLDSSAYTVRAGGTNSDEYWSRLDSYANGMSNEGLLSLWVINDDFVETCLRIPAVADSLTSHILSYPRREIIPPVLVFRVSRWNQQADQLRQKLEATLHAPLLGGWVTASNYAEMPQRVWGFIIAEEEVAPDGFQGQALPASMRGTFGEVPVIISPTTPDFQRSMVWLGTGAAGILFRDLPERGTMENTTAALHVRAVSTFPDRFRGTMRIEPGARTKGIRLELRSIEGQDSGAFTAAWLLENDAAKIELEVPSLARGRAVTGIWYNPETDENILQPVTTASTQLSLVPPGGSNWVYSLTVTRSLPDTATSVSAIRDWED